MRTNKFYVEKENNILIDIVELFPSWISVYNLQGFLVYANEMFMKEHHFDESAFYQIRYSAVTKCRLSFEEIIEKLHKSEKYEIQKQEKQKWYKSLFYRTQSSHIVHVCSDISMQKEAEISLDQSAVFFENTNDGIFITDAKGVIQSVNNAFSKITGYTKEEVLGKTPAILNSGIHNKYFYEQIWQNLEENNSWCGEIWNKRKNTEVYPEWLSISKVYNPKYEESFYIAVFSDISSMMEADKKLHYLANYDLLTGLANRVQLRDYLESTLKNTKKTNEKIALFFIDLDKFKGINDTHGHQVGDEMLKIVSSRIKTILREDDFAARIGGDEFVVVLKKVSQPNNMLRIAEKLNEKIKEPIKIDQHIFSISISVGIAIYPDDATNANDLIKNADAAMYAIKENGRDGSIFYDKEMTEAVSYKLAMQNELQLAIQVDQFVMVYQAVIDLQTDSTIGAEALVRWNHPKKGLIGPNEFLSFLDESNMSIAFGYLVIQKVCKDLSEINTHLGHSDFKIAINLDAKQFFEPQLLSFLLETCQKHKVFPEQIELELLETSIMNRHCLAQEKFDALKEKGFSIAIDDFGTGYSSLSYLKNFQVDKLKIDHSFIRDCLEDPSDKAIVEAIIRLANIFSLKVQAEGIESEEHHQLLSTLGCNYAQGFFYNKPLLLEGFFELYAQRKKDYL